MEVNIYLAALVFFWMALWAVTRRLLTPPANMWMKWVRWLALYILPVSYFVARLGYAFVWYFMGVPSWIFITESLTLLVVILAWFVIRVEINKPTSRLGKWPTRNYVWVMALLLLYLPFAGNRMDYNAGLQAMREGLGARHVLRQEMVRPVDPKDNAYDLYVQLSNGSGFIRSERDPMDLIKSGVDGPDFQSAMVQLLPELQMARQAASRPDCVMSVVPDNLLDRSAQPAANGFRRGGNLLAASARLRASQGDVDGAIDDLHLIYATATQTQRASLAVVGHLVFIGIHGLADQTCVDLLPSVKTQAQLARITLPATDYKGDFIQKIKQEGMLCNRLMASMIAPGSGNAPGPEIIPGNTSLRTWIPNTFSFNQAIGLTVWRETAVWCNGRLIDDYTQTAIDSAELPPGQVTPGRREVLNYLNNHFFSLVNIVLPSADSVMKFRFIAQARRDAAAIAIAATRHRLEHGTYPDASDKLVPAYLEKWPVDPFDDQPMRMKLHADGSLVIYSIGKDQKDNGGDVMEVSEGYKSPPDAGFVLKMPKAQ